jgi:hypothetical protein
MSFRRPFTDSFVTLRYTLLFAWIALCRYILVRFVPGGDLDIRFLRSGRESRRER